MTVAHIGFYGGIVACVLIAAFVAVLVIWKRIRPAGSDQVPDDAEHVIDDAPPPPYPGDSAREERQS